MALNSNALPEILLSLGIIVPWSVRESLILGAMTREEHAVKFRQVVKDFYNIVADGSVP